MLDTLRERRTTGAQSRYQLGCPWKGLKISEVMIAKLQRESWGLFSICPGGTSSKIYMQREWYQIVISELTGCGIAALLHSFLKACNFVYPIHVSDYVYFLGHSYLYMEFHHVSSNILIY